MFGVALLGMFVSSAGAHDLRTFDVPFSFVVGHEVLPADGADPVGSEPTLVFTQYENRFRLSTVALLLVVFSLGCSLTSRPRTAATLPTREFSTTVLLHRRPLELHLMAPRMPPAMDVLVVYASGDGGWFGTAVDMFRRIGHAGYFAVGFSSRAFLKIQRPRGALVSAAQLASEYEEILAQARVALGLDAPVSVVLTGWSRGAAFSVLVGSELAKAPILGVIAVGLAEDEDLGIGSTADEGDDGQPSRRTQRAPFDTYTQIAHLGSLPCAVIQATHDNYLPAPRARQLFGPETPTRRFYAIAASNHRFSGGQAAFAAAFLDAIQWVVSQPERSGADGPH